MKKKILFVSSLKEFAKLLNVTSNIEPGSSFISESLYYPKLIKKIDTDKLHSGIPNVIQITPELKYEFELPYIIANCKVEVYSWEPQKDSDEYSNFEKYTILILDGPCSNVFMKVSFFEDGSIAKAIYPKISMVTQIPQVVQSYPYSVYPSCSLYSYPYSYGCNSVPSTSYDIEHPTYEIHSVNIYEKPILYEYSGFWN